MESVPALKLKIKAKPKIRTKIDALVTVLAPAPMQATPSVNRVRTLIGCFEYGKLKSQGVLPNITLFNDIPKKGGNFPKIALKISPSHMGCLAEKVIGHVLRTRQALTDTALIQILYNMYGDKAAELVQVLMGDYKWFSEVTAHISREIQDTVEIEPEWSYCSVQGHPDIVTDDTIYDIKTTGLFGKMRIATIFQLLSYYALAQSMGKPRRYIGLILPAQNLVVRVDLKGWNGTKYMNHLNDCSKSMCHEERDALQVPFMLGIYPHMGSHIRKERTLLETVKNITVCAQIFFAGNIGSKRDLKFATSDILATARYIKEHHVKLFIHAPYAINLSRTDEWIVSAVAKELTLATELGCLGVVVHLGKRVTMTQEEALQNMRVNVLEISKTATVTCPLLLETDSGGSVLDDPDHLAQFYLDLPEDTRRVIGICLDTCHVFAAGYDLMTTLDMFHGKNVPVKLIHYNDSKHAKGSKLDRHAVIGTGVIPFSALYNAGMYGIKHAIPLVRE